MSRGAAVLVPVKGFHRAKSRLASVLDGPQRAALMRRLAGTVVAAAGPLPVTVATDDHDVARWAQDLGCSVHRDGGIGLDAAVTAAATHLAGRGHRRIVVAHADLPLATDLSWLADGPDAANGPEVVLVPDRRDDGTNVLAVPADPAFRFSYGPGSRHRHEAEAHRLGLPVRVVHDPDLGWDVDHPEDLAWPQPPRRSTA